MKKFPQPLAPMALLAAMTLAGPAKAAEPEVRATLVVSPAEVNVVGDATPLFFRFENRSDTPLAFMWEGCCRFNGKLTATRGGKEIPPTPPGQALAHMFAKAERLEPGQPKDFETRLSDWVILRESGEYELRGRYQGVLPFQRPQVPRGLELWRGTAETPPVRVNVLSVEDYLAQRTARSERRRLDLQLNGPGRLAPLVGASFRLKLTNRSAAVRKFVWPEDAQWWVIDSNGARVASAVRIDSVREEVSLTAGGSMEREITLDAAAVQDEGFGDYRVFIDLAAAGDQPRIPSNPVPLRWELGPDEIITLLREAAAGHRTGARNAPLKLLRTHLAAVAPALGVLKLESLPPPVATLASQLRVAACLKPHLPRPGVVTVEAIIPDAGDWRFHAPNLVACLGEGLPAEIQFQGLLAVRRHLGWEIVVQLTPATNAPLAAVGRAAAAILTARAELSTEPRAVIAVGTNRVTTIDFPAQATPASLVVRVAPGRLEFARRLPDSQNPARNLIAPGDLGGEKFLPVGAGGLEPLLADGRLPSPRTLVLASGRLTWGDLLRRLDALVQRGLALDVVVTD